MATSFEITPSMAVNAVYLWLEKYANKMETLQLVLQNIQSKLEAIDVSFEEEHWLDILKYINMRSEGWEDVKTTWKKVSKVPLMKDMRAWHLIQAFAYRMMNPMQVLFMMNTLFSSCFNYEEWEGILDPLCTIWEASKDESDYNPKILELFEGVINSQGLSLPPPQVRRFIHYLKLILAVQDEE
ncbi:hypothetical protein V8B97DRAFT_2025398 [Scleroderma yunnanense]